MSIKHHLKHGIFHNPSKITNLTLAVTHLETSAFRLQQLQVRNFCIRASASQFTFNLQNIHYNRPCVEFSANQYLKIYHSRYNIPLAISYLLKWADTRENCFKWNTVI